MPDFSDRLAELLYEAVRDHAPVVPYRPWADVGDGREKSAWRRIADALLASEEWQAREAVVEAAKHFLIARSGQQTGGAQHFLAERDSRRDLRDALARLATARGEGEHDH